MLGGGTIITGCAWSLQLPSFGFHTTESAAVCVLCSLCTIELAAACLVFTGGVRTTFVISPSIELASPSSSQMKSAAVSST
eukprot:1945496-Prymnesium_polylepis.1